MSGLAEVKPEREAFFHDTAEILRRGFVLVSTDLGEMLPSYGYEPDYATTIMSSKIGSKILTECGVQLGIEIYRGRSLFLDSNLDPEKTEVKDVKRQIDIKLSEVAIERLQQIRNRNNSSSE